MNDSGQNLNKKVLPPAVAVWAMLSDANLYLPETAKRCNYLEAWSRYTVHLRFQKDEFHEVNGWLQRLLTTFAIERGKLPWTQDGNGGLLLLATSSQRPGAVDASKNAIPPIVKVGHGSKLRVYVTAHPFAGFGGAINLQINSYQVLELSSGDEDAFNVENGYRLPLSHETLQPAPL
jgi:hypothetical protein